MVKRELLTRHRRGRKVYLALTPRASAVLEDGHRRVWKTGAVNRAWNGGWTLVGFSLPDSRRGERHDLRSQLMRAGFGPLQNGLWIARRPLPGVPEPLGHPPSEARDDLARQLLLHTGWLQLVRQDPHLPAEHLADDWPAVRAETMFRALAARYDPAAARIAAALLDEIALPPCERDHPAGSAEPTAGA
jgi:phenylacetic acid degradation operon negative regulatory protein